MALRNNSLVINSGLASAIASSLRAPSAASFNPASQFAANEPGWVYDINDLSTVYADSAGTTAASVNGPVGLVLDKRLGATLGTELVTNGDFSGGTTTGWTASNSTLAVVSGEIEVTASSGVSEFGASQPITCVVGRWYRVSLTMRAAATNSVANACRIRISTSATGGTIAYIQAVTSNGVNTSVNAYFLATQTTHHVQLNVASSVAWGAIGDKAYFDNISVKELPGNHAYQTSPTSRPVLRGTPSGGNVAPGDGTFDSSTGWTLGTGWAISGGKATKTAGVTSNLSSTATLASSGRVYRVTIEVSGRTAGAVQVYFGGVAGATRSANGTFVEYLTATSAAALTINANSTFDGSIESVDMRDVTADAVTAPYALQFDGLDDFLQTASIDFSGTDKVFVCAGVRKLSDAGSAALVELSASNALNIGSFVLWAPLGAAATFAASLSGNNAGAVANTGYETLAAFPAPTTRVFAASFDIAGATRADEVFPRVNGSASIGSGLGAANAGTGNFGNYPMFFGRRGGTSLPFNGLLFSSVCRGGTLPDATLLGKNEKWVADRTGVTL